MRPDQRSLEMFDIELPILLAPMAGPGHWELAAAVTQAAGLGALPCAMLNADQIRAEWGMIRKATSGPVNLNFFCHTPPVSDPQCQAAWRERLEKYYRELAIQSKGGGANRAPFDEAMCRIVEELHPKVVSFHFGLPDRKLLDRVKSAGSKVISSATNVREAKWLEENGCDAVIAQGFEAGGHRGIFLTTEVSTQVGTLALVPQVVDAVKVPVIAAGGIADGRGIAAAFALGASAVQIGSAYLFCPEARLIPAHRQALHAAGDDASVITNVFTGRPGRGIVNKAIKELGVMSAEAPPFPLAAGPLAPLRAEAEKRGSTDFSPLWFGQAGALSREMPATELTRKLADDAMNVLKTLARSLQ
jgi:nitronate monooxygenase